MVAMIVMHPGEYISSMYLPMEKYNSVTKIAKLLGVSSSTVSRLLAEKSDVTPEMALKLERVFGRSAESWLDMQIDYTLYRLRGEERAKEIAEQEHRAAMDSLKAKLDIHTRKFTSTGKV